MKLSRLKYRPRSGVGDGVVLSSASHEHARRVGLVFLIAAVAIALLAVRPRTVPSWVWPVGGAVLTVAMGYEPPGAAWRSIIAQWNVLFFIAGLLGISAAGRAAGAFQWITEFLLERARGSWRRLFIGLFFAEAAVTLLLSNDATVAVLTPIVYAAVARRGGDPKPFLFACIFVANVASFGLPFSNPANVLILPHARLLPYLWHLGPAQALAIATTLGLLLFVFRTEIRGRYPASARSAPTAAVRRTLVAMATVAAGYVVALHAGWPLGPVACAGAVLVSFAGRIGPTSAARRAGWEILPLLAALFVLLDAVARGGFIAWFVVHLNAALHGGDVAAIAAAAVGAALLSNAFNNLPVAVASSFVVSNTAFAQIAYPLIVGVDLGPNLVTTGSLATILWLSIARNYGVRITFAEYAKLGALILPATLLPALLWLFIVR